MTRTENRGRHAAARRPGHGEHARPGAAPAALRIALLPLVGVPVLLGAGATAYAYWTAMGTGVGHVATATAETLAVTAIAAGPGALHPGATSDLTFALSNPNGYAVSLTTLSAATVTSSDETGCPGATFLVLPGTVTAALASGGYQLLSPILVPARNAATAASLPDLVTLSESAPDACQGVTFTVTLAFDGSQA
jgi:hypothetical protein